MRFSLFLLLALGAVAAEPEPKPRYKLFPETIAPNGASCLAWGTKVPEGGDAASLVEVPAATKIELKDADLQDYLVTTKKGPPPLALPGVEYFSGPEGHEAGRGLSYAWAPDSQGVLVIYESDEGCLAAVWAAAGELRVSDVKRDFEIALRGRVAEAFGDDEARAQKRIFLNRVAMLEPDLVTLDGCLTRASDQAQPVVAYWFRMRFRMVTEDGQTRAEWATGRILQADELLAQEPVKKGETVEDQLERALAKVRTRLGPAGREALRQEQARWLKQRGALPAANKAGFTRHRLEELKIRAVEE